MRRSARAAIGIAAAAAVTVAVSLLVLDREPRSAAPHASASTSSLLTLTWGPSLCTVEPGNPGCRSGHVGRLGPVFVLHGLWPQPSSEQYCDLPRTSGRKPPVPLPDDLRAALQTRMSDASVMTSHEWYAHGTCSGVAPPEYFRIAAALTDQASGVLDPLFAAARGRTVSSGAVRAAVDAAFGAGAGRRVSLSCKDGGRGAAGGGSVAYEVRFSLPAVVTLGAVSSPSLREGLAAGPDIAAGCGRGAVP